MFSSLRQVTRITAMAVAFAVVFMVGAPSVATGAKGAGQTAETIGVLFMSPAGATYTVEHSYAATVRRYDPGEPVYPRNGCGCAGAATYPYSREWTERQTRDTSTTRMTPFKMDCAPGSSLKLTIVTSDQNRIYGLMEVADDPSGYSKFQDYRLETITTEMVSSVLSGTVQTVWLKNPAGGNVVTIILGSKRPW